MSSAVCIRALLILMAAAAPLAAQETPRPAPTAKTPPAAAATDPPAEPEAEQELPRFEEMTLPSEEELLSGERRDWIVLQDDRVLVVEPVFPRPNTLKEIQTERDTLLADPRRRFSDEGKQRLSDLTKLNLFVPGEEGSAEFLIELEDVREVLHHEDLMLRRADQLIEAGESRRAFELLFVVARRDPAWPGLDERQVALTAADAARFLDEGRGERALSLIESLYERKPLPVRADNLLEQAAALLVGEALQQKDYREARFQLSRIGQIDPRHPAVASWTNALATRAKELQTRAEQASGTGDDALAATLIEEAARCWPRLGGLRPVHERLTTRFQRLAVGVSRLASESPLAIATAADDRIGRLTTADLFEIEGFESLPAYRSAYFERWEPTDLGRRARFELRPGLPDWAARPALTSSDAVRLLAERMQPDSPAFDARFADLVSSLRPLGPFSFEVVFRRIPLRAEAALALPTGVSQTASRPDDMFRRFAESERTPERASYRRANAEGPAGGPFVAEITEIAFPTYEKAIQALDRGETRLLADVPAWDVPRLREDKRLVVTQLALPATHLLQFHAASIPFRTAELRRAVALAADANDLLRIVAGTGAEEFGRPVTAPFPSTHLGYDPLVEARSPDLALALALTLAAERRFEGALPEIVFAAPAEAPARQAAESLAKRWQRIGLPVRLATYDELGPDGKWDVAYRELSIADPVVALAPLITLDAGVTVTSLSELPEWLRQRLLDLERASDAAAAQGVLIDLHRLLHADVRCVPLFEVDRFLVTRGVIRGLPARPVTIYQNAERWVVPAEYPEEAP